MTELYLIAHKVRGEPAFDIAERLQIGEELGWIIPTSGWRAYPYWWKPLSEAMFGLDPVNVSYEGWSWDSIDDANDPPEGLRDHFAANAAPEPSGGKITTLSLADLGL